MRIHTEVLPNNVIKVIEHGGNGFYFVRVHIDFLLLLFLLAMLLRVLAALSILLC